MPSPKRARSASPQTIVKRKRADDLVWNQDIATGCSVQKQRYIQLKQFLKVNPDAKGKKVKGWLLQQKPDPQPDVTIKHLNRIISRQRLSTAENSDQEEVLDNTAKFQSTTWDSKPDGFSSLSWRRVQVKKFLDQNPDAKGKVVLAWINSHEKNPQPNANIRNINRIIQRLQNVPKKGNTKLNAVMEPRVT